jgi:hypothetical protein
MEIQARALVEALTVVNHATKDTRQLRNGAILFVDGERRSLLSWGPKEDIHPVVLRIEHLWYACLPGA